ncbi:hypothetical protein ACDF64_04885 [Agromyces sp. MMS24-JH15]|uniref:hypothetical protein n=1 Tax=Agromyces sp. MMS24-JH15 TaxID=3243765 RepID=UPI00374A939A
MNALSTTFDVTTRRTTSRRRARRMHERLAARFGLALLSLSRPKAALTHEEVAHRRHLEHDASALHSGTRTDVSLLTRAA